MLSVCLRVFMLSAALTCITAAVHGWTPTSSTKNTVGGFAMNSPTGLPQGAARPHHRASSGFNITPKSRSQQILRSSTIPSQSRAGFNGNIRTDRYKTWSSDYAVADMLRPNAAPTSAPRITPLRIAMVGIQQRMLKLLNVLRQRVATTKHYQRSSVINHSSRHHMSPVANQGRSGLSLPMTRDYVVPASPTPSGTPAPNAAMTRVNNAAADLDCDRPAAKYFGCQSHNCVAGKVCKNVGGLGMCCPKSVTDQDIRNSFVL